MGRIDDALSNLPEGMELGRIAKLVPGYPDDPVDVADYYLDHFVQWLLEHDMAGTLNREYPLIGYCM